MELAPSAVRSEPEPKSPVVPGTRSRSVSHGLRLPTPVTFTVLHLPAAVRCTITWRSAPVDDRSVLANHSPPEPSAAIVRKSPVAGTGMRFQEVPFQWMRSGWYLVVRPGPPEVSPPDTQTSLDERASTSLSHTQRQGLVSPAQMSVGTAVP